MATNVQFPTIPDHSGESLGVARDQLDLSRRIFEYQQGQDRERKDNIRSSLEKLRTIFGKRDPVYNELRGKSLELNRARLEELNEDAARNTRFALARAGNIGGSTEVDKNRELAERMGLGTAQAEIYAQSQADQLRAQDDALRGSLGAMAATGGITGNQIGSQARSALSGLRGTPGYMQNMDNTFAGIASQIGAAGSRAIQQPSTTSQSARFGF